MKRHNNNLIYISLISILLLVGQLSVLIHAEEHHFHDTHESCAAFMSVEQNDSTLVLSNINLPVIKNDEAGILFIISKPSFSLSFYHARAPPFSA